MEAPQESLDRLRHDVAELRASRKRLALAADADRRHIERELHDGPQQHLVALAVNIQLARDLVEADPAAASALLDEIGGDLQRAVDETAKLAERIYPPLLEAGGLGTALRALAVSNGVRADIEVTRVAGYPPEIAGAVYFCCRDVIERAGRSARAKIQIRIADDVLVFEINADDSRPAGSAADEVFDRLRDRVEALDGRLTAHLEPGRGIRVSGSLPTSR